MYRSRKTHSAPERCRNFTQVRADADAARWAVDIGVAERMGQSHADPIYPLPFTTGVLDNPAERVPESATRIYIVPVRIRVGGYRHERFEVRRLKLGKIVGLHAIIDGAP